MANGFNRVQLIGNLGDEPTVRTTTTGTTVANINLAINEARRDQQTGNLINETEWVRVVAFGRTAEIMQQYLHKGSQVHIEGKLRTRSYEDKNTGEKKYSTEVVCEPNGLLMLGSRGDSATVSSSGDDYSSNGYASQNNQYGGAQRQQYGNQQSRGGYGNANTNAGYGNGGAQNYGNSYGSQNSFGNKPQSAGYGQAAAQNPQGQVNSNAFRGGMNQQQSFNNASGFNSQNNSFGGQNNSGNFGNPDNAEPINDDLPF
ncbi:single-stranded DNA-binding protein [Succinivibrio dextrinosolvens]|jgi:single-strand DNA-binding protein|uniref:Single-stranded DNA-binding protein n=1 Tax=Succinivibrio dextrinosolvens DSM 3072 TaxID=1123324 RepID=A0A1T4VV37_9GAMM|nr:single-stranded DNA-binding protein [Succinivibrio dextrinosolvens]MBE6421864.1 single-stranded DNA-binding protein [Succinivibrio dextrinosolvens]MBQ3679010.1 single-stranded DNA-binding protein [Succinivibrio sp.]SKA68806.1 single-strand binding protein [Succinivibrio dextrinosolvens DSM 3072]